MQLCAVWVERHEWRGMGGRASAAARCPCIFGVARPPLDCMQDPFLDCTRQDPLLDCMNGVQIRAERLVSYNRYSRYGVAPSRRRYNRYSRYSVAAERLVSRAERLDAFSGTAQLGRRVDRARADACGRGDGRE